MALYPVIMCGGAGTRLWPASRPSRPKQFLALAGERSLFQETVARCAPLASGAGRLIVVAGVQHAGLIDRQLADLGVEATVLLEPEPRDSCDGTRSMREPKLLMFQGSENAPLRGHG